MHFVVSTLFTCKVYAFEKAISKPVRVMVCVHLLTCQIFKRISSIRNYIVYGKAIPVTGRGCP